MGQFPTIEIKQEGLGHALADNVLSVPRNQRSYDWTAEEVKELFTDLANAMASNGHRKQYFLGSIVCTQSPGQAHHLEIVDGQQRLATTSILIAAIRDYFYQNDDESRANSVESKYLQDRDVRTGGSLPNLRLNRFDNDFYQKRILSRPGDEARSIKPIRESHEKILTAAREARKHVDSVVSAHSQQNRADRLLDWVDYIRDFARVVWVTVPDPADAYIIFETLNYRGKDLSTSDLLKNYLLGRAGDRIDEVESYWTMMLGALEAVGSEDISVPYIRHHWCSKYGVARERELYATIKKLVKNKQKAIDIAAELKTNANLYAALLSTDHEYWSEFGTGTKKHIKTLLYLKAEQVRIVLLPVLEYFSKAEIKKTIRYLVSTAVRFLIAGGSPSVQEANYSDKAIGIRNKSITTAAALAKSLSTLVPNDAKFEDAFAALHVNKAYLARYYLRAIETTLRNEPDPEMIVSEDEEVVTLEHILPENPGDKWPQFSNEEAESYCRRIGNMTLLKKKANSDAQSESFDKKKAVYKQSTLELTKSVLKCSQWTTKEIEERQRELAKIALKTWPLNTN
jgi:hypothetical protein